MRRDKFLAALLPTVGQTSPIFFYNSLSVYNSLLAAFHLSIYDPALSLKLGFICMSENETSLVFIYLFISENETSLVFIHSFIHLVIFSFVIVNNYICAKSYTRQLCLKVIILNCKGKWAYFFFTIAFLVLSAIYFHELIFDAIDLYMIRPILRLSYITTSLSEKYSFICNSK